MFYWYRFYVGECPVCGRNKSYKTRVTTEPRPVNKSDRYTLMSLTESYCGCDP
jgi:hypothetical protein